MYKSLLAALLAALVLSSCQQAPPGSDAEDERNPFFRQASKDVADLNYPAAIKQFEKAIATNPTVDGEATASWLARLLEPIGLRVTRIGLGLPIGSDLEYADELTLDRAMEGRRLV